MIPMVSLAKLLNDAVAEFVRIPERNRILTNSATS